MPHTADRSEQHLALTQELWPRIAAKSLMPVGDGWTCDTYDVDGGWIVQFPRSEYAEEMLRKQIEALPTLAFHLPSPIPEPVKPVRESPVAMLYRRIYGEPFPDAPDGEWPEQLGRLLSALQSFGYQEIGIPERSVVDLRKALAEQLITMTDRVLPLIPQELRTKLGRAFAAHIDRDELWQFEPVLKHGDLGPAHILVDDEGQLAGVIDWEELALGDPASDFAWLLFDTPEIGRRVVAAATRNADPGWMERAQFLYALMPFHEVLHGLDTNQHLFVELGVRGIQARAKLLP